MDFLVSVTDDVGNRILEAFGPQQIGQDMTLTRRPATVDEVNLAIKDDFLRGRVRNYESAAAVKEVHAGLEGEEW